MSIEFKDVSKGCGFYAVDGVFHSALRDKPFTVWVKHLSGQDRCAQMMVGQDTMCIEAKEMIEFESMKMV